MHRRGLSLVLALSVLLTMGAAVDADGDGLGTVRELRAGTDVLLADTDGDGLSDGTELVRSLDPLGTDSDADGVADSVELTGGSDPLATDSDGDGVDDGREAALATDPLSGDTDDDGLSDGREIELGIDPTTPDGDEDGLDDAREVELGTDPVRADSDGDGLRDDEELARGTDPTVADSDGDGLEDGREREIGTDASSSDSDADGLADGREVDVGTDPLDPDTDGDGFPDGPEVHRDDVLPDADPLRIDVYVEVDAVGDASLPSGEVDRVIEAFDDAPVGSNGSRGIGLHVVRDETSLQERGPVLIAERESPDGPSSSARTYAEANFDRRGYGYHYLLVVPEVLDVPGYEVLGEADDGVMLVQSDERGGVRGSTFMHELGHSIGLNRGDFDGIDSRRYPVEEYPSVMSYASPSDYYGFSDGEPFDDWAAIEADLHVPDASRFNASTSG